MTKENLTKFWHPHGFLGMKDYRERYCWLVVDGKRMQIIAMREITDRRGRGLFNLPDEYHKYIGLRGIEIAPATCTEAAEYYHKKVAQIGRIAMPEDAAEWFVVDCQARAERIEEGR